MRRRHLISCLIVFLVLFVGYVGTFSYWWLHSPTKELTIRGERVHEVQFTFNSISWHTQIIWLPAFWFMEHVCGYERVGFIAMYEHSIMVYSK